MSRHESDGVGVAVAPRPAEATTRPDVRLLLVDDDPAVVEELREAVREFQVTAVVDVAPSGAAAIARLARTRYDVVISDIKTPGIDDLAELARTRKLRRHTPTLILTWQDQSDLAAQALRGGAYDFLHKPIDRAHFLEVLDRTLLLRHGDSLAEKRRRQLEQRARGLEQSLVELHQQAAVIRLLQDVAVSANEATNVPSALQASLDRLCAHTHWPVGHAYLITDATAPLRSASLWHLDDAERFKTFRQRTEAMHFPAGVGLPGRVLATGKIAWIADVACDGNFPRADVACDAGLKSGLAFPVMAGDEVAAILEFFSTVVVEPDEVFLQIFTHIGTQLGQVIKRARAEQALRESETRFRSVAQSAPDAIISADSQGRIVFWNQRAQTMFGYAAEEVLGHELTVLMPERYRHAHERGLERFTATGESHLMGRTVELHGRRKDALEFPLEISLAPWTTSKGTFFTAIIRDITHRKRNESHISRLNEQLARRLTEIEAISRDATEHKRAEEQVKVSLKEKEVLLREVHHRVKNNLQVICSLLKMQSAYIKDKQALEVFKETQNRVRSIALVHERLYRTNDMARIDFAEYVRGLTTQLFRSCGVTADAVGLTLELDSAQLNVETAIPCGLILNELLTNSLVHAFPDGKGQIRIEFRSCDSGKGDSPLEDRGTVPFSGGNKFTLSVRDNGIGFSAGAAAPGTERLGWSLIRALAGQLNAALVTTNQGGTEVRITFQELSYKERGW
jgi:PAS domain S-box-containing protein